MLEHICVGGAAVARGVLVPVLGRVDVPKETSSSEAVLSTPSQTSLALLSSAVESCGRVIRESPSGKHYILPPSPHT